MICPKCKRESIGNWCVYCGESFDEEKSVQAPEEYAKFDTSPLSPIGTDTNYRYRDDVAYPGEASDGMYGGEQVNPEELTYYNREEKDNKVKLIAIVTACGCAVLLVIFLLVQFMFPNGSSETEKKEKKASQEETENKEAADLFDKGEKFLKIRDYESAEEIYRELTKITNDDEALLLHEIVLNYNQALAKRESAEYDEAKRIFDKIPVEYIDYDISEDVEVLSDEIDLGISTYETFDNIKKYMESEDFEAAGQEAEILDVNYLSENHKEEFEKIRAELEKIKEEQKDLTSHEAEDFLMEYCDAMAKAVNNNDFSIVTPYIDRSSQVYTLQKDAVSYCASEGIVKRFDSLRVKDLARRDVKNWDVSVTEIETVIFEDGTEETKTYDRTYTITYSDSDYYITGIK